MEISTSFLTEKEALAIPPPKVKTHIEHWGGGDFSFFGIRVMRAKAKSRQVTRSWVVRWHENGRDARKVIARVGKISYNAARKEALDLIEKVRARRDSRENVGVVQTFEQAYEAYASRRSEKWAPDTLINYRKSIGHLLPHWGNKRVDQITETECSLLYAQIRDQIALRAKDEGLLHNGRATAVGVMRLANTLFIDLLGQGALKTNPCRQLIKDGVFKNAPTRSRMIPAKQIPVFWRWLHTHPAPAVRDYILMSLFMALRHSVVGSLRWSNLVQAGDRFYYVMRPDQRGNKRGEEIPVPIPTYLEETVIKPRMASPTKHKIWIIESPKILDTPLHSVRGTYEALAAKTGLKLSDHDLRRTIATLTNALCGDILAKRILTHSVETKDVRHLTTSGYVITEKDELLEGMNKVIDFVRNLANETPVEEPQERSG